MFVVLMAGAVWLAAAQKTITADTNKPNQTPSWERINHAAMKASKGDATAVGALADEVLAHHGIDQAMGALQSRIRTRLVAAEVDYQNGNSAGLTEDNVVAAVNHLAQRFNAPAYAYTTVDEVKTTRLQMLTLYPNLMGRGPAVTRDDSKPHFDKSMSPIEAFHTAATLVVQKVFNPDFQVTLEERQAASSSTKAASLSPPAQKPAEGQRTGEMLMLLGHAEGTTRTGDLLNECDQALDLLGIRR